LQGADAPRLLPHQLFSPGCRLAKLAGGYRQANQGREQRAGKKGFMQQTEMNDSDDPDQ